MNHRNCKGQSLVEFALVVPLLLILVFGIVEFGMAWMTKNTLTGAAREAVRVAAMPPPVGGTPAGQLRGAQFLASAGIPAGIVMSEITEPDGHVTTVATVTYTYNFWSIIKLLPGIPDNVSLVSTTTMRREY